MGNMDQVVDELEQGIRSSTPPTTDGLHTQSSVRPIASRPGDLPYRQHDNRPVTPPPPQTPSPEYMSIASQEPEHLSEELVSLSRKLLILDLNGTLLHRGTPIARGDKKEVSVDSTPRLRKRAVHPRPYMPSFRWYLFAPSTKRWLDVMVWSSAQPHSVNDMVNKTFGEDQDELVAIWARDTLGLSEEQYSA